MAQPSMGSLNQRRLLLILAATLTLLGVAWVLWWTSPPVEARRLRIEAWEAVRAGSPQAAALLARLEAVSPAHAALVRAQSLQRLPETPGRRAEIDRLLRMAAADPSLAGRVDRVRDLADVPEPPLSCAVRSVPVQNLRIDPRAVLYAGPAPVLSDAVTARVLGDIRRFRGYAQTDVRAAYSLLAVYESGASLPHSQRAIEDLRRRIFMLERERAQAGRVRSMIRVAEGYANVGRTKAEALGEQQSLARGERWYRRAAEDGNQSAQQCLARFLRLAVATPQAKTEAHRIVAGLAAKGNAAAISQLGRNFYSGDGVARDPRLARTEFERSAAQSVTSQAMLAQMLLRGEGGPVELERGRALLVRAARAGNAQAEQQLGDALWNARFGFAADREAAQRWLQQAASKRNRTAMVQLARIYGDPASPLRNERLAARWALRAIDAGAVFDDLLIITATAYAAGTEVPRDPARSEAILRSLVAKGNASAMLQLGRVYFGRGTADGQQRAIALLQRSAQLGQSTALVDLGRAYASGAGVPVDPVRANYYFQSAALAGNPDGMLEYARSLAVGFGTAENLTAAAQWYLRVAEMGVPQGMINYAYAAARGEGIAQSFAVARQWVERAAATGDAEGLYWLAVYKLEGYGGGTDRAGAIQLLNRAVDKQFSPARVLRTRIEQAAL